MDGTESLREHLRSLTAASADLALDATITPETFARSQPSASEVSASVGPLPRIALSGVPGTGPKSDPIASADLEILGMLGEGGMGRVHLARQRSLGREVAIKMLKDEVSDAHATEMLRVEATIMGRLEHPNVVPVHAVGLDGGGRLVLVMKRIDGAPWRDLMRDPDHPRWQVLAPRREDRLDAHLGVLVQVCNALELAHQRGVIHRDVKPENVLLGAHGEVYLADWGIALRTDDAEGQDLVGTPAYMAPEMVVGIRSKIDARTDVFLLGATLHELLTGSAPNRGPTLHATLLAAMDPEPPAYDAAAPIELAAIARRAMAKDPTHRFASALDFRRAIDEVRNHRGSIALTRAAKDALASLERTFGDASASHDGVDRPLTECRFALASALREWPGNDEARRALATCLRLAIRRELDRESPSAARALLDELDGGDDALAKEIDALDAKVKAKEGELARLRELDRDVDFSVGLGPRIAMFVTMVGVAIALTVWILLHEGATGEGIGPWDVVRYSAIIVATVLVIVALLARRLLANALGRRITLLFVLATVGMLAHRIICAVLDVRPSVTVTTDLLLIGIVTVSAWTVMPRVAVAAWPFPIGIVLAIRDPAHAPLIFSLTTFAMFATMMVLGIAEIRKARAQPRSADRRPRPADDRRST